MNKKVNKKQEGIHDVLENKMIDSLGYMEQDEMKVSVTMYANMKL